MFDFFLSLNIYWQVLVFFFYGAVFGSFANVLIYRLQQEKPISLFKASFCPHCSSPIPFYWNVPIISWFLLKGSCFKCSGKISFRYPLVEFLMAVMFPLLFFMIGWKWFLIEALIFGFALLVASFIDWDKMILPDSLTLSGIGIGLLGAFLNPERSFMDAVLGVLFGGGILILIAYFYYLIRKKEGMGGGDVKMLAWIGAVLGWKSLFFVLFCSCVLGSVLGAGMIMLQSNKKVLQTEFPFGPYLALSAFVFICLRAWNVEFLNLFFLIET